MIAGPIIPRTLESLWELVQENPERLERGLRLVHRGLVLEGGLCIDVLARDAAAAPVLLFGSVVENDGDLPRRLFETRDWFARNQRVLASALDGIRFDLPARLVVVGFDYSETCLHRLRSFGDDLTVFRLEGFFLGGERHIGVVPVVGGADPVQMPFELPPVFLASENRNVVTGFLDLLQRLDPDLGADGDRYSRRYYAHGTLLTELRLREGHVEVAVPGAPDRRLFTESDRASIFDDVMRRYLAGSGPDRVACPEEHAISELPVDSFEQRLAETELSAEEYEAFQ